MTGRFCFLGILLLTSALSSSAQESYDPIKFLMDDGKQVWGVLVEETTQEYVVATSKGAARLAKKSVQVPGTWGPHGYEINELLLLLDQLFDTGEIDRALSYHGRLLKRIKAFEDGAALLVRTQLETRHDRRGCLLNAIAHYKKRADRIPRVLAMLDAVTDMHRLVRELDEGLHALDLHFVDELMEVETRLFVDTEVPRLRRLEQQKAREEFQQKLDSALKEIRAKGLQQYNTKGDPELLRDFVAKLVTAKGRRPRYPAEFSPILDDLVNGVRNNLLPPLADTVTGIFTFGEQRSAFQKQYRASVQSIQKASAFVHELTASVYGEQQPMLQKRADALSRLVEHSLDSAAQRRSRLVVLLDRIVAAELALRKGNPAKVLSEVDDILLKIQQDALPEDEVVPRLKALRFEATAANLVLELQAGASLPQDQLAALIARTNAFLEESAERLTARHGVTVATYRNMLRRLKVLHEFRQRLDKFQQAEAGDSWSELDQLNRWVQQNRALLPPEDVAAWDERFANTATAAQEAIEQKFSAGTAEVRLRDLLAIGRLVSVLLEQGQRERATALVNGAIQGAKGAKVLQGLIDLQFQIAEHAEGTGDLAAAVDLCRRALSHDERYAHTQAVNERLFRLLLKQAKLRWAAGQTSEAMEAMTELARTYPELAEKNNLYAEMIDFELQRLTLAGETSAAARWRVLDTACAAFPDQVAEIDAVVDAGTELRQHLAVEWEALNYMGSYESFLQLEEAYPALSAATRVWQMFLADARTEFSVWQQEWLNTGTKLPPHQGVSALHRLVKKYPVMSRETGLDSAYVNLKIPLAQAQRELDPARAFQLYGDLIKEYPQLARESGLAAEQELLRWRYQLERIKRPLRIRTPLDWVVVGFAVLAWLWLALGVISGLRERGHGLTRFLHLLMTATVFGSIQTTTSMLHWNFALGFVLSFIVPGLLFMVYALRSCRFFPLIYFERWIAIQKLLSAVLKTPGLAGFSRRWRQAMVADFRERERDLSYVHDYSLYRIHRAIAVAQTNSKRGAEILQRLGKTLENELVKGERWNERYHMCMNELGSLAMRMGDAALTIECFGKDLENNPDNPDSFTQQRVLGELLFQQGHYDDATAYIRSCLAAQGGSDKLWYQLGRCHFEAGRPAEAAKSFNSMLDRTRDALFYGARAFFRANDRSAAIDWYQQLLKRDPNDTQAIYYMASCFAHQGQDRKAVKLAGLIPATNAFYGYAQAMTGNLLLRGGKVEEAEQTFTAVLRQAADCVPALLGLAQVETARGNGESARKNLQVVLSMDSSHPSANFFMGTHLELESPDLAQQFLLRASEAPQYERSALNYVGRIQFFRGEYQEALRSFEQAASTGEQSPWFLYFYAYTLAVLGKVRQCESILLRILGRNHPDAAWQKYSVEAMYSIGVVFFESSQFKLALRCFEFVQAHRQGQSAKLAEILEETRFRQVIGLLAEREYDDAEELIAKLQIQAHDPGRSVLYQYYLALCHLYQGNYSDAGATLSRLMDSNPDNVRFKYHHAIADFGLADDVQGMRHLRELAGRDDLPGHLSAGVQVVHAYIQATRGNLREAAEILGNIAEIDLEFPGVVQVRRKVIEAHLLCLCHLRDSSGIQDLIDCLPPEEQGHAAYFHALAALSSGAADVALRVLQPHAEASPKNAHLCRLLASDAAQVAVDQGDYRGALELLAALPASPDVDSLLGVLRSAACLTATDSVEQLQSSVDTLTQQLEAVTIPTLRHTIVHNLNVLHFRVAQLTEASAEKKQGEVWKVWQDFWSIHIMDNVDYWKGELAMLGAEQEVSAELAKQLTAGMVMNTLMPTFEGFVVQNLGHRNESGINRHVSLLEFLAVRTDQIRPIAQRLTESTSAYLSQHGGESESESWDMRIAVLTLQARLQEMLRTGTEMAEELAVQRQSRSRYRTPRDYDAVRSKFVFELIDAIQSGLEGHHDQAGKQMTKVLRKVPPGIPLGRNLDRLHTLREAALNPKLAVKSGMHLPSEWRKMYDTIKRLEI